MSELGHTPATYPDDISVVIRAYVADAIDDVEAGISELRDEISSLRAELEGQIERNESLIYESIDQHERDYDHDGMV